MRRETFLTGIGWLALVGIVLGTAQEAAAWPERRSRATLASARQRETRQDLTFEGGVAEPLGDLGDPWSDPAGFGARTGYELGLRYRYFLGSSTAVAPAFHYVNFGDHTGVDLVEGTSRGYTVRTSLYRFGIDLMQYIGSSRSQVRGFLLLGVALVNNRYRDFVSNLGEYRTSMTALSFAGGAGLRLGPVELSAVYNFNRPESPALEPTFGQNGSYDWDFLVVRGGLILTRF